MSMGPFCKAGFGRNTGIEAGMELTNMSSIIRYKWSEAVSLTHRGVGEERCTGSNLSARLDSI